MAGFFFFFFFRLWTHFQTPVINMREIALLVSGVCRDCLKNKKPIIQLEPFQRRTGPSLPPPPAAPTPARSCARTRRGGWGLSHHCSFVVWLSINEYERWCLHLPKFYIVLLNGSNWRREMNMSLCSLKVEGVKIKISTIERWEKKGKVWGDEQMS